MTVVIWRKLGDKTAFLEHCALANSRNFSTAANVSFSLNLVRLESCV